MAEPGGALLNRARAGDLDALAVLFKRELPIIRGKIRKLLRDDRDVEDVLQETYLKASVAIQKFRGDAKVSSWLCKIAINLSHDRLRDKHHHVSFDRAFPEELVRLARENTQGGRTKRNGKVNRFSAFHAWEIEKDWALVHDELRQLLLKVLHEEMKPEERMVITLTFFSQVRLSAEEIAARTGFNKRTKVYEVVRKYTDRCRELRDAMLASRKTNPSGDCSP